MKEELGLQQRYMFRKRESAVEGEPTKSSSRVEAERGVEQQEVGLKIGLVGIN